MRLENIIEAVLFYKGEPISFSQLAKILEKEEVFIREAVINLKKELEGRGVILLEQNEEIALATHPDASQAVERLLKEETSGPLSKASLETLSIICYRGPVTKSDIDYIRGVNSHFILRSLSIRGLVTREQNPKDARTFLYKPTFELLSYLGLPAIENLPDYHPYRENFKNALTATDKTEEQNG